MAMQNNGAEDSGVDIEQERRKADEEEEEGKILSERLAQCPPKRSTVLQLMKRYTNECPVTAKFLHQLCSSQSNKKRYKNDTISYMFQDENVAVANST